MTESKQIEFKREFTSAIKYTAVAFANSDGGKIYIGIDDDGNAVGVAEPEATALRVGNLVRDAVLPDLTRFTDCAVESIGGKSVVVLTVRRGTARPYYLAGKGVRPEGVYVRQGAASVPASETEILELIKETSGDCFEDARALEQRLSFAKAEEIFGKKGVEFGAAQQRTLGLVGADGMFSNLGVLISDQCFPVVKIAEFDGSTKSVFRDRREPTGSLLAQLEETLNILERANATRAEFSGFYRIDTRDYPEEALREALFNAFVHRDYSVPAPTLISIFDDRIEIVSFGGLLRGTSLGDVMLGVSVLRNRRLANIFYRLKLIEAYGTGILKINECYAEHAVKPKIEVSEHAFKITLPNVNFSKSHGGNGGVAGTPCEVRETSAAAIYGNAARVAERERRLVALARERGALVRADVESALGVSQASAILILREMLRKGLLVKLGAGKNSHYAVPSVR